MNKRFSEQFQSLTGFRPMKWQCRLFEHFIENQYPARCDIPTGLGKTSIIVVWLLALSWQASYGNVVLPRRLVYVVNRRTVVDQATKIVLDMRCRLLEPELRDWHGNARDLREIATALRSLCTTEGDPLAVSTLRGELADNEEWKSDPSRPAIIIGTIDMIGSKLLFNGYGDHRYGRSHHAGLIGHDALIIHDEAHLTPAFCDLLRTLEQEQKREGKSLHNTTTIARPIRTIELSATSRGSVEGTFKLDPEDEEDEIVQERINARKLLHLHTTEQSSIVEKIADLASAHEENCAKVLIYVRSPEDAQRVASALRKANTDGRVAMLTGTIRGYERDKLVKRNLVYRALLDDESQVKKTVYLVSTSAGEVGIDLDADHMVCDVVTLDVLIQRIGRVNRRGGKDRVASVDVVLPGKRVRTSQKESKLDKAISASLAILQEWYDASPAGIDVSPRGLREQLDALDPLRREAAFSPKPTTQPVNDIVLDAWSLTSINGMPGQPGVADYLHGLTYDTPETCVAWRKELAALQEHEVDEQALRNWFSACRIEVREKLRDRTDRVKKSLAALLKAHRKILNQDIDFHVALLDERGDAHWSRLSKVVAKDFDLAYRTIVLPVEARGLDTHGMLSAKATGPSNQIDVAEDGASSTPRERWLYIRSDDGERYERLLTGERADSLPQGLCEQERIVLKEQSEDEEDKGEALDILLTVPPRQSAVKNPETAKARQTLKEHTDAITTHMARIAGSLGLDNSIQGALVEAARWHDRGKDRPVWQRYAHNPSGTEPLAKSTKYLHPRSLGGYRHEFGSLQEALLDERLQSHAERDLILHLIAAHHGWARPHFERRSFDQSYTTQENEEAAVEAMRRFGRLQERFGRWGLAWLESLLRCADIAASQKVTESSREPLIGEVRA